jgi:hypothetical protein
MPEPGKDRVTYWEGSFGLMVAKSGHKSYVVQYRADGKSWRMSLRGALTLQEARREAKAILGTVAKGGNPLGEKRKTEASAKNTLQAISQEYLRREAVKLRTAVERARILEKLVYPRFGGRQIDTIKRSEIVRLLDDIEEDRGPHRAQMVLAILSKLFNWHASRDDDFLTPIRRGMTRVKPSEYARDRFCPTTRSEPSGRRPRRFGDHMIIWCGSCS